MAAESLPVQVACTVLGVSESGYYANRHRAPSQRSIRHAMLTDLITQIHDESHGICGARRVHAELTLGRGSWMGVKASVLRGAAVGRGCVAATSIS